MPKLIIHFARFGPYHLARLRSANDALKPLGWIVKGLQVSSTDSTYNWSPSQFETYGGSEEGSMPEVVTAFPGATYENLAAADIKRTFTQILDHESPDAIAIAGWSSVDAMACCRWAGQRSTHTILMSETRKVDGKRVWWKETLKARRVRRFDAALVGARSHAGYLKQLGMPTEKIGFGYNVVDNGYFTDAATEIANQANNSDRRLHPCFLSSNRFVSVKNLDTTLEAYRIYLQKAASLQNQSLLHVSASLPSDENDESRCSTDPSRRITVNCPWHLCLLGDGPLRDSLITQASALGLRVRSFAPWEDDRNDASSQATIYFPGFRQIEELPRFYANATAFLHPALSEPWGLVINEAMACSLPILSSTNVAAAEELLDEGVNGFSFDPLSPEAMADSMLAITDLDKSQRLRMGKNSLAILNHRMPTSAFGEGLADVLQKLTVTR